MATNFSSMHVRRLLNGNTFSVAEENPTPVPGIHLNSWHYRHVKRGIDILGSASLLLTFAVPGIVIAAAIRVTSRGPIFYHEERIGRHGRPFRIWKFRSMHPSSHSKIVPINCHTQTDTYHEHEFHDHDKWRTLKGCTKDKDPRITPVGDFLRRWSLDELPQFINVLRGEMSLIGPRPLVEAEIPLYRKWISFYYAATPGLSGLWQVSGRSDVDYDKRAKLDAIYVQSWSLVRDFKLIAKTIPAVLSRAGAR